MEPGVDKQLRTFGKSLIHVPGCISWSWGGSIMHVGPPPVTVIPSGESMIQIQLWSNRIHFSRMQILEIICSHKCTVSPRRSPATQWCKMEIGGRNVTQRVHSSNWIQDVRVTKWMVQIKESWPLLVMPIWTRQIWVMILSNKEVFAGQKRVRLIIIRVSTSIWRKFLQAATKFELNQSQEIYREDTYACNIKALNLRYFTMSGTNQSFGLFFTDRLMLGFNPWEWSSAVNPAW